MKDPSRRVFVVLLLALVGCEDPLKPAQSIEESRVLGVRVATSSDGASVEPGQSALVDVLLAGPPGTLNGRLSYRFCSAADSERGVPFCEGAPFAEAVVDLNGVPIAVDVPASIQAGDRLVLLGVACLESEPLLGAEALDWSCSAGDAPLRLSFDARSSSADFANQNPDLSGLAISVGGASVPLDDPRAAPSCLPDTPAVAANAHHAVQISLGDGAREPAEALQLSTFSTGGLFERHYSFVAPEQPPSASLDWLAPAAGVAVKQYAVVRDGRGGVSWVSWSLCAQ